MADRVHRIKFTVDAPDWLGAEQLAADRIRTYTHENRRGRGARTDDDVLRDAEFEAEPLDDEHNPSMWRVTVRVTV